MQRTRRMSHCALILASFCLAGITSAAHAQAPFTYQGQLKQGGSPANGNCDFQFQLFDALSGGNAIGQPQQANNIAVNNGLFTVRLNFGFAPFNGDERFLEIGVRCPAGSGNVVTLNPRQVLTPVPYSLFAPPVARAADGSVVATLSVLDDGGGALFTFGPNGNNNVLVTSLVNHPNNGFVGVYDDQGAVQAGIYVDENGKGQVFATGQKPFVVDYPNHPDRKIMYVSLEGPEAAIYHRGVVKLVRGRATIELPEHFIALASPDSITVQLTPGSLSSQGLAFSAIHDGRIDIGELHNGKGSYDVHFVVHALRRGYEDQQPVIAADAFRAQFKQLARKPTGSAATVSANAGFSVSPVTHPAGASVE